MKQIFISLTMICCAFCTQAQKKQATISGIIYAENNTYVTAANISLLTKNKTTSSNDSGRFTIQVPAGQPVSLIFSHAGFKVSQRNFFLNEGEHDSITVIMSFANTLQTVVVGNDGKRKEVGVVELDPTTAVTLPSTIGGVEGLIKTLVGSNNELSSQYNVRGGNFDENLVYINDYEVFRPYLVSSGQQEGLSIINPALAKNVSFYTGGFQASYGDKMSSVLDIQYKKPTTNGGSVYLSLLEQGMHLEGTDAKKRMTYIAGARTRNNRNVLGNQPTQGSYRPVSSDLQGFITYDLSTKIQLEMLGIFSRSAFNYQPESVQKTSSVFSPFFTTSLGLDIFFEGQEKDAYKTSLLGGTINWAPRDKLKFKFLLSRFTDKEQENFDIGAAYLFGERDFDNSSTTFGQIINPLGAGYYQNYGRNALNIDVWNAAVKGTLAKGKHYLLFGNSVDRTTINDQLSQFEYRDSAGYSLPYQPGALTLFDVQQSSTALTIYKYSGYLQDNIILKKQQSEISLQAGIRYNYNSLNNEFFISPRMQASIKPNWKNDVVFKLAAGVYNQPPFYRELRNYQGFVNTNILSQKSVQFVAGADYKYLNRNNSPVRITTELYYKSMKDVVPYDIDNVKIRYLGNNNATAYTAGAEFRFYGELSKGAQSWLSLAFMRSRENLANDFYYLYTNAAGEVINANTPDQVPADSLRQDVGSVRRPTDRLITVGMYLEDYLATNKNFKAYINLIYGSNMSYNLPANPRFRNGLTIDPYIRADIGLSALLLSEKNNRRSHNPLRGIDNIWASLEVFNIIDRANTISYQLIKDFSNTTYAIPNRLTPRLLNLKLLMRF